LKIIDIKKQKNGINNDTKLIDLIKPSSLILRACLSWSNHPSILSSLAELFFDLVLAGRIISRSYLH